MACNICTEKFNRSVHLPIKCMFCQFEACRSCCTRFIHTQKRFTCMNPEQDEHGEYVCRKEWSRKFMARVFTKSYMTTEFKELREDMLYEVEQSLFPYTQSLIEAKKERVRICKEYQVYIDEQQVKRNEISEKIRLLMRKRDDIDEVSRQFIRERDIKMGNTRNEAKLTKNFIRACPVEDCRGFLSSQWKCGLCDSFTCPECHVPVGSFEEKKNHVCNEDDVKTAQLLNRDTKPCPKCATGIFKIEGCDQMWCTQCHTAFSWRTGRIETNIHNPHYYEWQRRNNANGEAPRNMGDNTVCGEVLDHNFIDHVRRKLHQPNVVLMSHITKYVRGILHLMYVTLHTYRNDQVENNQEERIQYLEKVITKEQFRKEIQRKNKAFQKNTEIHQVLQLFILTSTEILLRFVREVNIRNQNARIRVCLTELYGITEYANECFLDIGSAYNSVSKVLYFGLEKNAGIYTRNILDSVYTVPKYVVDRSINKEILKLYVNEVKPVVNAKEDSDNDCKDTSPETTTSSTLSSLTTLSNDS